MRAHQCQTMACCLSVSLAGCANTHSSVWLLQTPLPFGKQEALQIRLVFERGRERGLEVADVFACIDRKRVIAIPPSSAVEYSGSLLLSSSIRRRS